MIFRKENRGESFQRQIANLRQQIQPEDEPESSDYDFDERQDTSQFAASTSRGESYAPPRTTDLLGTPVATTAPAATTGTQRGSWQTADANTSIIATNAHWNGTLRSDGSLHVHGRADGELHAANDLFVAEGAEVDAEVYADNVVVAGVVRGRIDARTRLEVLPQGHVAGDVRAPKLVVHEGARLTGQLKMESGGDGGTSPYSTGAAPKGRRSNA
ncbi:MAG TPA: polymer-forming cytoskeletal protein [Thermomicrobiaceae bacterium]|nr:polymer-forming cytoskeletal protein [Thermomicrobiaceae bacterium]